MRQKDIIISPHEITPAIVLRGNGAYLHLPFDFLPEFGAVFFYHRAEPAGHALCMHGARVSTKQEILVCDSISDVRTLPSFLDNKGFAASFLPNTHFYLAHLHTPLFSNL